MAGWQVYGNPRVGKSSWCKFHLIPHWRDTERVPVVVLDPVSAEMTPEASSRFWNHPTWVCHDPKAFRARLRRSGNLVAIVDEVLEWIDDDYSNLQDIAWLSMRGGNHGILPYYIAHRLTSLPPRIRRLCTDGLVVFNQDQTDAESLYRENPSFPEVLLTPGLPPGVAIVKPTGKPAYKIQVF